MTSWAVLGLPGIGSGGHGCDTRRTDERSGSRGKLNAKLPLDRCPCIKQSRANTDKCWRQRLTRRQTGKCAEEREERDWCHMVTHWCHTCCCSEVPSGTTKNLGALDFAGWLGVAVSLTRSKERVCRVDISWWRRSSDAFPCCGKT